MPPRFAHLKKNRSEECFQGVFLSLSNFKQLLKKETVYKICPVCVEDVPVKVEKKVEEKIVKRKPRAAKKAAKKPAKEEKAELKKEIVE